MGSAGITRVLGRRRHPVVTRPPVLGVVRHAGLRAIRRAVGTPERRAHDRATFRKPLPNRCFCECRRQPWRRLSHATTPPRTVNGESDDFSSRARSALRTDPCGRRSLWAPACLVRSDSPRLLRNWRLCHPVVTDRCCAPAFLAGCGTRSARHAAPLFRDGRTRAHHCHGVTSQPRAVRSDRVALCCAALGVAKAARTACSEAGASPAERRT
ncbi:MAG: hypothetical protein RJA05_2056 [Planctomycetota bacterium]